MLLYIVKKLTSNSQKAIEPEVEMETNLSYSSVTAARQRKEEVEERHNDVLEDYATVYI